MPCSFEACLNQNISSSAETVLTFYDKNYISTRGAYAIRIFRGDYVGHSPKRLRTTDQVVRVWEGVCDENVLPNSV